MFNIPLQNIANIRRTIYLFNRHEDNSQRIQKIEDFFPFFYEIDANGSYKSYDNLNLRKVYCSEPFDVSKLRSLTSYSSDIKFTNNFLIHKIDKILLSNPKYCFIDIEIQASELPNSKLANYLISCITLANSLSKEIKTWFLVDYKEEKLMLEDFIKYLRQEKFDIILGWNIDNFDYPYIYRRCKTYKIDFAKEISPIFYIRKSEFDEDIFYPAGISILDYLKLTKKVHMREASYALEYIAQKYLNEKSTKRPDFSKLTIEVKEKNINDIKRLVKLEQQWQLIEYYNQIRILAKCQWEDLYSNMRIAEALLFEEAKNKNIILPNKQRREKDSEQSFQGAIRDTEAAGLYFNCSKYDLSSAYPTMIVNFNLDIANITNSDKETIKINNIYFKQDKNALLPSVVKKMLQLKDKLKKQKKENFTDKTAAIKYGAIKGIVNSLFGVFGSSYFRLFNISIAETITYLVRDLLTYVIKNIEKNGLKVIYYDTDSVVVNSKENIVDKLNQFIKNWAKEKYNKENINLQFEFEGVFKSLCILGKCHYYGYIEGKEEPEIRGVEVKRSSSSKFEAKFQEELLNKVLNKETKEQILNWIEKEQERIKTLDIEEVSFPCKIKGDYKVNPIFNRAYENTKSLIKNFRLNKGELFYYIFMNKNEDVLAFTSDNKAFIRRELINWEAIINRSIYMKANRIFEALKWYLPKNFNQLTLF